MATQPPSSAATRVHLPEPAVIPSLVALLVLPLEVVALSLLVDTVSLEGRETWWSFWLEHSSTIPQIAAASVAAALLLVAAGRLQPWAFLSQARPPAHRWYYLAGQTVSFAAFAYVTHVLFESASGNMMFAAWLVLGVSALICYLGTVAPLVAWGRLLWQCGWHLAAATGIGLTAWFGAQQTQLLWQPLANWTFAITNGLLRLFYSDVLLDPTERVIGTSEFYVRIAPACSGYEGIGLVTVWLLLACWIFRSQLRFPQAFLLVPLGVALIWLCNAVRIAGLIVLGAEFSPAIALQGFHSQAGWLAFNAVALGIVAAGLHTPYFTKRQAERSQVTFPTAPYLVPLLVTLAALIVTSALSSTFDWLYPLRVCAVAAVVWLFRKHYRRLTWAWSWPAVLNGVVVFAIWLALEPADDGRGYSLLASVSQLSEPLATLWTAFRVVGSVLLVPFVEELAFRGYLLRRVGRLEFESVDPKTVGWFAILGTSLLFGLMHGRWFAGTIAGVFYAAVYRHRGRLSDAIVAHAVTNGLIAAAVLFSGRWFLWG